MYIYSVDCYASHNCLFRLQNIRYIKSNHILFLINTPYQQFREKQLIIVAKIL